ncbi:hypothetical protein NE237_011174 [Protea cynaroides]|uniref:Uncharacterized protein n=1 Tax=Protea cynaroides TaxID=273540 RepID=A0A9Q0JWJ0_9MAGN|nr:hypothetical protein NE237_011174 [Protea cynaroides]
MEIAGLNTKNIKGAQDSQLSKFFMSCSSTPEISLPEVIESSFLTSNAFNPRFSTSSCLEMVSFLTMLYTSLKDLLPSPPGISSSNQSWDEIPIKSKLVKNTTSAYLQSMSSSRERIEPVLIPKVMSTPPTSLSPLCINQFALVNHACAMLPFRPYIPHPPETKDEDDQPEQQQEQQEEKDHSHGHGLKQISHRHRLHHHQHHRHHMGIEIDCCRWLKEVDTVCVCEVLLHLPVFLRAPKHTYRVLVSDECDVTYSCPGIIKVGG